MSLNRPSSVEWFGRSGTIQDEPVTIFPRNPHRIGAHFQNQGTDPMWLVITDGHDTEVCRYKVMPNETWYCEEFAPINTVGVLGTAGQPFAASEYGI